MVMASTTGKLCGPCEARYKTTSAISWCMDCDDGLCSSCLEDHKVNKASKKHQIIPINKHLDKIESDLLKGLESKSEQNISEINILLAKLKERGANVKSLGKTIHQLRESLSDVQVFIATKGFGEKLREEQEWVATVCTQNEAKESVLELSTDPQLKQMVSDLKDFGMIHVVRNPCHIKTDAWEHQRAQLNVSMTAAKDIDQTELELIREITFESGTVIKDCAIVNDGRIIFASSNRNKVLVYTPEGQLSKAIRVDRDPFGLAVISSNTVAATCRDHRTINIVNIDDCVVKQKIKVGKRCCGLSYHDEKLYVLAKHTGIMEFNLSGNLTRTIPVDVPDSEGYLSYYKDTFCYTCYQIMGGSYITCCDDNGTEIWTLDVADSGVTADNYGNYFASNNSYRTLKIVSADGKKTKQLLPVDMHFGNYFEGVFFDNNTSTLLVSCTKTSRLYRVI
ncbi:uncharacterized protein [Mytilus edulis]|uniref:uncharacterized protein n=1 Tax=Mytilus edulis TaxID=6550 RepID=UPI0039EF9B76